MLQKSGGLFTLTADADFGVNFGLKSAYYKSRTSNVAATGQIRLANADVINFRNSTNSADLSLRPGSSDTVLRYAGIDIVNISGVQSLTNKTISGASPTEIGYLAGVTSAIQTQINTLSTSIVYASQAVNVKSFGAIGNGIADDTTSINNAIASLTTGGAVFFPKGTYLCNSDITIALDNITLYGEGQSSIIRSGTDKTIRVTADGFSAYNLVRRGPDAASLDIDSCGFILQGSSGTPLVNIKIKNVEMHNFRGYGVRAEYVDQLEVSSNYIHDLVYVGVGLSSVNNFAVNKNFIKDLNQVALYVNSYGIFISHASNSDPVCTNGSISYNNIDSVALWEGLDAHGGDNVSMVGNIVTNTPKGITIGPGLMTAAPKFFTIANNVLIGLDDPINGGNGITIQGNRTSVGVMVDYAENISVIGNSIRHFGFDSPLTGGIATYGTMGLNVTGNTIQECQRWGVSLESDTIGANFSNNTFIDMLSTTADPAGAFFIPSDYVKASINGNVMQRGLRSATNVNNYFLNRSAGTSTNSELQIGNNNATFVTGYYNNPGTTDKGSAGIDGTVSLPGLSFASDLNTGLYRQGTDTMGAVTAGTEWQRWASNGRIDFYNDAQGMRLGSATAAQTYFIYRQLNDGLLHISGGSGSSAGVNIQLNGGTSSSPNVYNNRIAANVTHQINASGKHTFGIASGTQYHEINGLGLAFNGAAANTTEIYKNVNDGIMQIYAANGLSNGAGLRMYGKDHATKANILELTSVGNVNVSVASAGDVTISRGNLLVNTVSKGLQVKEGSNAKMGNSTLVAGTVTVANTSITASSRIFLSRATTGGTVGHLSYTKINATSFTINSSSVLDTSTIDWFIVEAL